MYTAEDTDAIKIVLQISNSQTFDPENPIVRSAYACVHTRWVYCKKNLPHKINNKLEFTAWAECEETIQHSIWFLDGAYFHLDEVVINKTFISWLQKI
jgi:hypothetical protein